MKTLLLLCVSIFILKAQDTELFTCGMHPTVIQNKPGKCPICGMDLTPVSKSKNMDSARENHIMHYRAPMDPTEIYSKPGLSKMGMKLIPVYQKDIEGAPVRISPALQQNIGLRTTLVSKQFFINQIKAYGQIQYDESRINMISTKFNGWIEKLYVNKVGQSVNIGDPLYELYSPEVVAAQEEYVSAIKMAKLLDESGEALITSAKKRLEYWDISSKQIKELESSLKVRKTVTIYSPYKGIVAQRNVMNGSYVKLGTSTLEIKDMSTLWIMADFYDTDIQQLKLNDIVEISITGLKQTVSGQLDYIYPELNIKNRTIKARIVVTNPTKLMKINMFTDIVLQKKSSNEVLVIPSEAVIKTGNRTVVVVKNKDMFLPRDVILGQHSNGQYEVIAGLHNQEEIVTSAQFLIDSESKLNVAIQKLSKAAMASEVKND